VTGRTYYLSPRSFDALLKGLRTRAGADGIKGLVAEGPRLYEGAGRLVVDSVPDGSWRVYKFGIGPVSEVYRKWAYGEWDGDARMIELFCDGGSDVVYER
jgi:hypothetical protein